MTIILKNFRLQEASENVEVSCEIVSDDFPSKLSFFVPREHAGAIDIDEPNWAPMSLYWQAMMMGQDLVVEADLSPVLLYRMRGDLMALMRNYEPLLKPIRIEAGFSTPALPATDRDVMTGFSGGVDSFATFLLYTDSNVPPSLRLTALAVFQVGALGPTGESKMLLPPAVEHARKHADRNGLRLYSLWANMDEVYEPAKAFGPIDFRRTVGLRNAAAALLLQNGVRTYLPSGSVGYDGATYGPYSCTENLDPALQPLLATEKLGVHAAGAGLTRTQKQTLLLDDPQAQMSLNVCLKGVAGQKSSSSKLNCSTCWKCIQTLLVLETHDRLDAFREVFDVDLYLRERRRLLSLLVDFAHTEAHLGMMKQLDGMREAGFDVPQPRGRLHKNIRNAARRMIKPER
ncbi:hypothetical protein [Roseibium sp. MMSF_3412]|uniref:hypothetical protein n=1 Tax=Roseibium sp. MMSF_3412 TaxID=3046712 RepID=UPI00273FA592|nr:hypothetical protein [Roseibium sp. MMSF_3412]